MHDCENAWVKDPENPHARRIRTHLATGGPSHRRFTESLWLLNEYQTLQGGSGGSETAPETLDKELLDLRARLAEARSRYTEDFPDVVALKQKIDSRVRLRICCIMLCSRDLW